jgi:hypothetical protein
MIIVIKIAIIVKKDGYSPNQFEYAKPAIPLITLKTL